MAYARELSAAHDTEDERRQAVRRAEIAYVTAADAAREVLDGPALAWFAGEHDVLLRVGDGAARAGRQDTALRIAWALSAYHQHVERASDRVVAARAQARSALPAMRVPALRELAEAYAQLAVFPEAERQLTAALDLATGSGDHAALAGVQLDLCRMRAAQGDHEEALGHGRRALGHYRAAGDRAGELAALHAVGQATAALGDATGATGLFRAAIDLRMHIGDTRSEAAGWEAAGDSARNIGHVDQAIECYRQALELYRRAGDRPTQTRAERSLAALL
ncbi:MAG: hypothetical protein HOV79_03075 [Hamadaea sp.]|nr:hypothetical protein [Hamadaea sp.]